MSESNNVINIDGKDRRPWAIASRELLLRAAIAEIAERGYEHARLVDIAARADMTVGAIYGPRPIRQRAVITTLAEEEDTHG